MAGAMACGSSCLSRRPTSCPLPISGVDSPCHRGRSRERQFLSYGPRCAPGNAVICVVLVYLRCSVGGSRWLPAFGQRCFKQRRAEGRRSSCTVREDAREVSRGVSANAAFDGRRSSAQRPLPISRSDGPYRREKSRECQISSSGAGCAAGNAVSASLPLICVGLFALFVSICVVLSQSICAVLSRWGGRQGLQNS